MLSERALQLRNGVPRLSKDKRERETHVPSCGVSVPASSLGEHRAVGKDGAAEGRDSDVILCRPASFYSVWLGRFTAGFCTVELQC